MVCKNCGNNFQGDFCNSCGQKNIKNRFTIKEIVNETIGVFTNYDSGLKVTIKEMFLDPFKLINNYLNGKRIVYYNPFKLLILVVFIKGFIIKSVIKLDEFKQFVNDDFYVFYQIILYLITFSLFSFIFFRKQSYNFPEHIVINVFYHATIGLVFILIKSLEFLFNFKNNIFISVFIMTGEIVFFLYYYYKIFKGKNGFVKIIKSFLVFSLSVITSSIIISFFY